MKIFQKIYKRQKILIKIFGVVIYEEKKWNEYIIRKYLFGLFSSKKTKEVFNYYFLGILIRQFVDYNALLNNKLSSKLNVAITRVQRSITIAIQHQRTFLQFKNCNVNNSVVLIGAGPTVKQFVPIASTKYCALNRSFLYDKVEFDYLFAIDKAGIYEYYDEFIKYHGNNCIKFVGDQNANIDFQLPESLALSIDCLRYKTTTGLIPHKFSVDIDSEPIGNFCSVSLQAMQFLLYTNPRKIFLVGLDCNLSTHGHFIGSTPDISKRGEDIKKNDARVINDWKSMKEFIQIYYPTTEIISINPVGLKGVFTDIYTDMNENYVDVYGNKIDIEEFIKNEKNN